MQIAKDPTAHIHDPTEAVRAYQKQPRGQPY
jgi:hypothetical protein